MSNKLSRKTDPGQPVVYQIRIKGHLGPQWTDWFAGMTITLEDNGDTILTGPVVDQAALHGLIKEVRDLGMPLVSICPVRLSPAAAPETNETQPYRWEQEKKMNTSSKTFHMPDRQTILSTLWIFVSVNYIYCDVVSHMEPAALRELISGTIGSIQVTQGFLLAAAIMMEIPFAMILLSRVLRYRANRWANIVAGAIMVAIQVGTMNMGTPPTLHYLFYSAVEIACDLFIVWYAWKWTNAEV